MANKLYFSEHDNDGCYLLKYFRWYMKENCLDELILFRAKRENGTGYFFCKEYDEVGEVGESCGKMCSAYIPNNGKNGRCKHYGFMYEQTDEKLILKTNQ